MGSRTRLAGNDARGDALYRQSLRGGDGTLVVNRLAERIYNAADHGFADRHAQNLPGALDFVAFADLGVVAQKHSAYLVLFEAHGQPGDAMRKLQQLAGHDLVQAMNAGDAVAEGDHSADFIDLDTRIVVGNLLPQELRDFVCLDLSHASLSQQIFKDV